jgi:hypothetical protein
VLFIAGSFSAIAMQQLRVDRGRSGHARASSPMFSVVASQGDRPVYDAVASLAEDRAQR